MFDGIVESSALPSMNSEQYEAILAPYGGSIVLYLSHFSGDSAQLPFVRVRLDGVLLNLIAERRGYCRENSAVEVENELVNGNPRSREAVSALPDVAEHKWLLKVTATSFSFACTIEDSQLPNKHSAAWSAGRYAITSVTTIFKCLQVDLEALMRFVSQDDLGETGLAPFRKMLGSNVFLSAAGSSLMGAVAAQVPDVAAALTAEAMRTKVAETISADSGRGTSATRRRRIGV
jgi:hypothetical protein